MLAYLAQGKLHVYEGEPAGLRTVESAFGKTLRQRAVEIEQRHSWKTQGRGAQFMMGGGALWGGSAGAGASAAEFPILMTGVTGGTAPGGLLYSIETNEVAGIFAIGADGVERRIFHTADYRIRYPAISPDGSAVAASFLHRNGTANVGVIGVEGTTFEEATEGDSLDLAPRWVPGGGRRALVFQSAGLGRDAGGRFSGFSPFAIEEIDLASGAMATLAEDAKHDLLTPQLGSDGSLYYIRRPYAAAGAGGSAQGQSGAAGLLTAVKDAALFPFRMAQAVFQFLNFFSMRYSGKPLNSAPGGGAARNADLMRMMMLSNLLLATQAGSAASFAAAGASSSASSLVPSSWQLVMRRGAPDGPEEVLAKGVLSFDLAPGADGRRDSVLYSTGKAIHRIGAGGESERLVTGELIEQVTALG